MSVVKFITRVKLEKQVLANFLEELADDIRHSKLVKGQVDVDYIEFAIVQVNRALINFLNILEEE